MKAIWFVSWKKKTLNVFMLKKGLLAAMEVTLLAVRQTGDCRVDRFINTLALKRRYRDFCYRMCR